MLFRDQWHVKGSQRVKKRCMREEGREEGLKRQLDLLSSPDMLSERLRKLDDMTSLDVEMWC